MQFKIVTRFFKLFLIFFWFKDFKASKIVSKISRAVFSDFKLESNGRTVDGSIELGDITLESSTKLIVRNNGNAPGFVHLLVDNEHLIPSPGNFVLRPQHKESVTLSLNPKKDLIGPLTGSISLFCGTEVCRQVRTGFTDLGKLNFLIVVRF